MTDQTDQTIELLLISAAAEGARYLVDFCDKTGLSKKETSEILHRLWRQGTFDRVEERMPGEKQSRVMYTIAGDEKRPNKTPIKVTKAADRAEKQDKIRRHFKALMILLADLEPEDYLEVAKRADNSLLTDKAASS